MLPGAEAMTRVSPDGEFFAGTAPDNPINGNSSPAFWTRDGGLVHLPLLEPDNFGQLRGMSDDGSVMVGELYGSTTVEQVVWLGLGQPVRIEDFAASLGLDMTGWRITNIGNVSADGSTIVGTARHESWASGHLEGFVLTIPAPGAGAVVLAAGALGLRRRRR